jgi:hypothetical protein
VPAWQRRKTETRGAAGSDRAHRARSDRKASPSTDVCRRRRLLRGGHARRRHRSGPLLRLPPPADARRTRDGRGADRPPRRLLGLWASATWSAARRSRPRVFTRPPGAFESAVRGRSGDTRKRFRGAVCVGGDHGTNARGHSSRELSVPPSTKLLGPQASDSSGGRGHPRCAAGHSRSLGYPERPASAGSQRLRLARVGGPANV